MKFIGPNNETNKSIDSIDREIDLNRLVKVCKRNKNKIIFITIISGLIGLISAILEKPFWKGEFDIVLNNEPKPELAQTNQILALLPQRSNNKSIETQVEILKSPSVLMPVFNEFKKLKEKDEREIDKLRYEEWAENLNINLVNNTSVLNITYSDLNKEVVLFVLNNISQIYKKYSKEESKISVQKSMDYINNEIKKYENLYFDALQKEKGFSTENNLSFIESNEKLIQVNKRKISEINRNIDLIKKTKIADIYELGAIIFNQEKMNADVIAQIETTLSKISEASTLYTKNDYVVQGLKNKFEIESKQLKEYLLNFFINKRNILKNQIDASFVEPSLIKERLKLVANIEQKKSILESLNKEKITLSLYSETRENPWKLITNPTLFPESFKPSKKLYTFIGLIIGFSIGFIIFLIKESQNQLILTTNELKQIFYNIIQNIFFIKSFAEFENDINYVLKNLRIEENINFLILGNDVEKIKEIIKNIKLSEEYNFEIISNLKRIDNLATKNIILILRLGNINRTEIDDLISKMKISKSTISNLIIIDDELKI